MQGRQKRRNEAHLLESRGSDRTDTAQAARARPSGRARSTPRVIQQVAGIALFAGIALGTTAGEIATGLALLAVLLDPAARRVAWQAPLTGPLLVLAVAWLTLGTRADGHPWASLGRIWSLVPLLCAAALPMPARWGTRLAIPAAMWCLAGALVAVARARGLPSSEDAGAGPWDHHLTATYALIGPAVAAVALKQYREGAILGLGVLATGSMGGVAGLATALATMWIGLPAALAGVALALFAPLAVPGLVGDRAVLWTSGAQLAGQGGVPPGGWRAAVSPIHQQWQPTFEFPHHAHDTALQLAGDAGPAAWLALGWAVVWIVRHRRAWALPLGAALVVGGWSQDWFGDLGAVRSAGVWLVLALREAPDVVGGTGRTGSGTRTDPGFDRGGGGADRADDRGAAR